MKNPINLMLLAALVLIAFASTLQFDFILISDDEQHNIIRHHHDFWRIWSQPHAAMYIPITYSIWTALWKIWSEPALFHAVNVIIHLINTLLVYLLCRRLSDNSLGSLVGAAVFAGHPFQIEPVAWCTGLKDLAYTLFALLAIHAYISKRYSGAVVACIASILCKPAGVVIAPILLFLAIKLRRSVWTMLGCSFAVLPICWYMTTIQGANSEFTIVYSLWTKVQVALDSIGFYVTRLAFPFDLNADHARVMLSQNSVIVGVLSLIAVGLWRRFWMLFFIIALIPVLGFIAFDYQNWSHVADRYMYLPMCAVALGIADLLTRPRQLVFLILPFCIWMSFWQVDQWRDAKSLHTHAILTGELEKPNSFMILGLWHKRVGDMERARQFFRQALTSHRTLEENRTKFD
jgi:hypothetical protein